jgi:UDP-galactopyranose mutase
MKGPQLKRYVELTGGEKRMTFVARLGTYRYPDMHVTIAVVLDVAERFLGCTPCGEPMPAFVLDPLG